MKPWSGYSMLKRTDRVVKIAIAERSIPYLGAYAYPSEESRMHDLITRRVKQTLVQALGLDVNPDEIDDDEPLFGEGLGGRLHRLIGNRLCP